MQVQTNAFAADSNLFPNKSNQTTTTSVNNKLNSTAPTPVNNKSNSTAPTPVNNKLNSTAPTTVNNKLNSTAPTPINNNLNSTVPTPINNKLNSSDRALFINTSAKLNSAQIKNHRLFYPLSWKPDLNPYAPTMNQVMADWLTELKIIKDQETLKIVEEERADIYGGYPFPSASFEKLTGVTKFLVLWIIFDDVAIESCDNYWEANNVSIQDYIDAIRGNDLADDTDIFLRAWWEVGQYFAKNMSQKWRDRMANNIAKWLRETIRERETYAALRKCGKLPDLSTYLDIRCTSVGVVETLHLVEYVEDFELPDEVHNHPSIKALHELGTKLIILSNDIVSLEKDMRSGWPNTVNIIQQEYGLTLSEALAQTVELHNDCVSSFIDIESKIPSFGSQIDTFVRAYVKGMRFVVRGIAEFQCGAERYQWKRELAPGKAPFAVSLASFVDK